MTDAVTTTTLITLNGSMDSEVSIPHAYVGTPEITARIEGPHGRLLLVCKDDVAYETLRLTYAQLVVAGQKLWPSRDFLDEAELRARQNIARYGLDTRPRYYRPSSQQLGL